MIATSILLQQRKEHAFAAALCHESHGRFWGTISIENRPWLLQCLWFYQERTNDGADYPSETLIAPCLTF